MEVYNYIVEPKADMTRYFRNKDICFLDIETTGLNRRYDQIYLIGLLFFNYETQNWNLKQIFAHNVKCERYVLEKLNDIIKGFDLIVTYNGNSFDLPFIYHRSRKYSIDTDILDMDTFDIYRKIRAQKSYLELENLKLKTIEEELGIYREDEYSGKDCIDLYYSYMNTGNETLRNKILKHNYDDLYYLADIMEIFEYIEDIKSIRVPFGGDVIDIKIEDILEIEDILKIHCRVSNANEHVDIIHYEDGFNMDWGKNDSLIVELEFNKGMVTPTKGCSFINKANIYAFKDLKDFSHFVVPRDIVLLKVEDRYEMKNIKYILAALIKYVLTEQNI